MNYTIYKKKYLTQYDVAELNFMTDINDYVTGKVVKDTNLEFFLLKFVNPPLIGSSVRNRMINALKNMFRRQ